VRGYAHVIKEDTLDKALLFLGTEFGLWISVDGGAHWGQFKGGDIPAVAVRDVAVQARDADLVLATHGRGIWIIDDITPLRHLTPELLAQDVAFVSARPVQQRIEANGGAPTGAAAFVGDDPVAGAVITYYQRSRHLFGKLKIEVLDPGGHVIDELPASSRRGLNRVLWTMHLPAPHVPPAVQVAFAATQGPRVVPGTYTIRIEDNGKSYDTRIDVGLDRRVTWSVADRKAQYEAAMKVYTLFNDETQFFAQVVGLRQQVAAANKGRAEKDPLHKKLADFDQKLDKIRKEIVATTEGGAITGEERLREHTDQLYGAITSWDGPPARYQLDNIAALRGELDDISTKFEQLTIKELPGINRALSGSGGHALEVPPATAFELDDAPGNGGGGVAGGRQDADSRGSLELPKDLRLWQ
jgi:hypothetical protein